MDVTAVFSPQLVWLYATLFSLKWEGVGFGVSSGENESQRCGFRQDFYLLLWECGSWRFFFFFLPSIFSFLTSRGHWTLLSLGHFFMGFGWVWLCPLTTEVGMWPRPGQGALFKSLAQVEWYDPSPNPEASLGLCFPRVVSKKAHSPGWDCELWGWCQPGTLVVILDIQDRKACLRIRPTRREMSWGMKMQPKIW